MTAIDFALFCLGVLALATAGRTVTQAVMHVRAHIRHWGRF
jgi:hypothetical protein